MEKFLVRFKKHIRPVILSLLLSFLPAVLVGLPIALIAHISFLHTFLTTYIFSCFGHPHSCLLLLFTPLHPADCARFGPILHYGTSFTYLVLPEMQFGLFSLSFSLSAAPTPVIILIGHLFSALICLWVYRNIPNSRRKQSAQRPSFVP